MEQLQTAEYQTTNIDELTSLVHEKFGEDAVFSYSDETTKTVYTMTFEEALVVCGEHITSAPLEIALTMLESMHNAAERLKDFSHINNNPDFVSAFEKTRINAQQKIAERAIAQSVA